MSSPWVSPATAVPEYLQLATHGNCTGDTDIICYRIFLCTLYAVRILFDTTKLATKLRRKQKLK